MTLGNYSKDREPRCAYCLNSVKSGAVYCLNCINEMHKSHMKEKTETTYIADLRNGAVIMNDTLPSTDENRFRDCIKCGDTFKKPDELEFFCPSCRKSESHAAHRRELGNTLQDANGKLK